METARREPVVAIVVTGLIQIVYEQIVVDGMASGHCCRRPRRLRYASVGASCSKRLNNRHEYRLVGCEPSSHSRKMRTTSGWTGTECT